MLSSPGPGMISERFYQWLLSFKARRGVLVLMATCAVERDQVARLQLLVQVKTEPQNLFVGSTLPWSLCRFCQWRVCPATLRNKCKSNQICCCCCYKPKAVTRAMVMWQDPVDWLGCGLGVGAGRKRLTPVRNLEGDPCSCITFQREGCTGKQLSSLLQGSFPPA